MEQVRLTRAEIAVLTGISKPTISEGVRRLVEAGLVMDTGERSSGPGRAGGGERHDGVDAERPRGENVHSVEKESAYRNRAGPDGDDSGRQYYKDAADGDRTYRLKTNEDDPGADELDSAEGLREPRPADEEQGGDFGIRL